MSSLTNINNNSSVVNVGRTTPVTPGQQPAAKSIPVVLASDQSAIPVVEQNKIQSEVALSLLGIPRSEVALGIFADVNTYDVNPVEWSAEPSNYVVGHGIDHLPEEAGALIEAPKNEIAILTSKRFFRYQPGRVSAATFGVKSTVSASPDGTVSSYDFNPSIRKFGIFDKFDGYYWETKNDGVGDNFCVVRRTQSLLKYVPAQFTNSSLVSIKQQEDYGIAGKGPSTAITETTYASNVVELLTTYRFYLAEAAFASALSTASGAAATYLNNVVNTDANLKAKCLRDLDFALDAYINDIKYGGTAHTIVNATTYQTAVLPTTPGYRDGEQAVHTALGTILNDFLVARSESISGSKIKNTLVPITFNAVGGTIVSENTINTANYGSRSKLSTIFSVYARYYGYLVAYDPSLTYAAPSPIPAGLTADQYKEQIKHKCLRDVGYVMEGYLRDLEYGGNAATMFNAHNYYFDVTGDGTGRRVFSQQVTIPAGLPGAGTTGPAEVVRHYFLKRLISETANNGTVTVNKSDGSSTTIPSMFKRFNLSTYATKFNKLADTIINNFITRELGQIDWGIAPQFGHLVIYRDNLIMTHAAVHDPSLLKPKKNVVVRINTNNDTLEAAEGSFIVDQHIIYQGCVNYDGTTGNAGGLVTGKVYKVLDVSGPKSNIITLVDPLTTSTTKINITVGGSEKTDPTTGYGAIHYIQSVVPFIFPDRYYTGYDETNPDNVDKFTRYDGQFPYMYAERTDGRTGTLPVTGDVRWTGYIDTGINPSDSEAELIKLRTQIDIVNLKYNNWIKQNVDPKYYAVYEYRVPRSRFSQDQLNGLPSTANPYPNLVVYSDRATGENGKALPGQAVTKGNVQVTADSAWDMDFSRVTMLKIEFSWYGAVGALFLAYVPVANGEARWVRVHHLRCSNQLKIPSLGNATLPITYLVYGGGSTNRLGLPTGANSSNYGVGSDGLPSHNIVKYGASYYIDGGDRGTVRLYSYSRDDSTEIYGSRFNVGQRTITEATTTSLLQGAYFTVPSQTTDTGVSLPTDLTYFMGAKVVTTNKADQNVRVIWVDVDNNRLYINKPRLLDNRISLIVNRPSIVFGLKAKENILNKEGFGVRNRVQVYPTKLSTANLSSTNNPVKLKILKTPYFQPDVSTTGSFYISADYEVTTENKNLSTSTTSYLAKDNDYVYGWMLALVGADITPVFGKLTRTSGLYYFTALETFGLPIIIKAGSGYPFLREGRFDSSGKTITGTSEAQFAKERLSSVYISSQVQCPVPGTGTEVAAFFLKPGSDHFDLLSYFDYNKDYLSFPLTNQLESLYLSVDNTKSVEVDGAGTGKNKVLLEINASLTWEEQ